MAHQSHLELSFSPRVVKIHKFFYQTQNFNVSLCVNGQSFFCFLFFLLFFFGFRETFAFLVTVFLLEITFVSNFFQGVVVLGWALAAACNLAVLYGLYEYNSGKAVESIHVNALYQACSRTAWGLGLAWVIFACCRGYGGKLCIEAF